MRHQKKHEFLIEFWVEKHEILNVLNPPKCSLSLSLFIIYSRISGYMAIPPRGVLEHRQYRVYAPGLTEREPSLAYDSGIDEEMLW